MSLRVGRTVGSHGSGPVFRITFGGWAGHHRRFVHVGDGDGHRDTVRCAGQVSGGNRHGVAGLGFIVQGGFGLQLAGRRDNGEGRGIPSTQGVGQRVAAVSVSISGRDRGADVGSRRRVLGNAVGSSTSGELRGAVV